MTIQSRTLSQKPNSKHIEIPNVKAFRSTAVAVGTLRRINSIHFQFRGQWIPFFLATVIMVTLIASLNLDLASRTAIAGREIQRLQRQITNVTQANADLQTNIATLLSNDSLNVRALAAGYQAIERKNLHYIVVPGYFPSQGLVTPAPVEETLNNIMLPEYSESLISWINRQLETASQPLAPEQ